MPKGNPGAYCPPGEKSAKSSKGNPFGKHTAKKPMRGGAMTSKR